MSNLHVDSVIKSFGKKQLLTDVFISCRKGEIVGLLGRNGSGKSTLLKIIFGSLPADNKFIKVDDKVTNGILSRRKLITYLPQEHFLPSQVKIKNIIELFCSKTKSKCLKEHHLISSILDKKAYQLSGGEQRLLEVLLMIFSDSKYTLMDEPFNGIAPINKEYVKQLIQEQSHDKGFIITDHDYKNIFDIASRVVIISNGVTREIKDKTELLKYGYLSENRLKNTKSGFAS